MMYKLSYKYLSSQHELNSALCPGACPLKLTSVCYVYGCARYPFVNLCFSFYSTFSIQQEMITLIHLPNE